MVKVTFELKDELDAKFRKKIAERKGLHKGVISEALEEAIKQWMETHPQETKGK